MVKQKTITNHEDTSFVYFTDPADGVQKKTHHKTTYNFKHTNNYMPVWLDSVYN